MKVVYELIDAELDAVCGGIFDFTNLSNNIVPAKATRATPKARRPTPHRHSSEKVQIP